MTKTLWFGIAILALIIGLDIYLEVSGLQTISELVLELSSNYPLEPFLFGIVAGHFFWPQSK